MAAKEETERVWAVPGCGPRPDGSRTPRPIVCALVGSLAVAMALPAAAQRTVFSPYLTFGIFATTNVDFVGEDGRSDSGYRLGLTLPVEHTLERGSLSFGYAVAYNSFRKFSSLDNTSHRLFLNLTKQPSRRSTLALRSAYTVSQRQGDPESEDPADLFLVQRTDRKRASLILSYGGRIDRRWSWGLSVGGSGWRFEEIRGFDSPKPGVPLEDRNELRGHVEATRTFSLSSSVGLRYGYRLFDLEISGEETVHLVSFVFRREIEERLSLELTAGGYRSSGVTSSAAGSVGAERSGFQGTFRVTRSFRRSHLSLQAGHVPSAGGARIGTSTNSYVGISYGSTIGREWSWGVFGRLARRDPNDPERDTIDSFSLGSRFGRDFGRHLGIRFGVRYVDQSSDEPGAAGSYLRGDVGMVWYPLGRK